MAGFKQSILGLQPKLFLTFDGDDFDPVTYDLLGSPKIIMDESGEGNNALFHTDHSAIFGHRLGMPSLVELEQAYQYALTLGFYGAQPGHPSVWAKTFLEVPHTDSFEFPNMGSFSVSMMLFKQSDENAFRQYYGNMGGTLRRPLISKGAMFSIDYVDYWSSTDRLEIKHPAGSMNFAITPSQFYGDQKHLVFVWDVVPDPVTSSFRATATLYLNGRREVQQTFTYPDTVPNTNVAAPWFIGGNTNSPGTGFNDRQTSHTTFDQIAVFDTALSHDQICWLFKKTRIYERVVSASFPSNYWPFDDAESIADTAIKPLVGNVTGQYLGGTSKVLRRQNGPPKIPGSLSAKFQNGGCAVLHRTSSGGYSNVFNPAGDYTIHFWFNATGAERGVVLSIQSDDSPFNGILLQLNLRNNIFSNGGLQFNVTEDYFITSREFKDDGRTPFVFNDGNWHFCSLVRRSGNIELWLDGVMHSSAPAPVVTIPSVGPGQVYLMSMMPGKLSVSGNLAHMAFLSYALQTAQLKMLHAYSITYRIKGAVTLQGVPYQADIRAYRHLDGELLQVVRSDPNDGNYLLQLPDNSLIDLMILNTRDTNVRYRAYGPILPSEYEDTL